MIDAPLIINADREAAADAYAVVKQAGDNVDDVEHSIRCGEADDHPIVQAFARHRLSVTAQPWQPVEIAPRDGSSIIGAFFHQPWAESHREGRIVQCWWQPEFKCFISSCREMRTHNGHTFEDGSTRRLHSPEREDITHWISRPDTPAKPQN